MKQHNITEPAILDLNGMWWTENGADVEFIDFEVHQIEDTINRLLSNSVPEFGAALRADLLLRLRTHTHIIKNGSAYSYLLLEIGTFPTIIMRMIPTEFTDDGEVA